MVRQQAPMLLSNACFSHSCVSVDYLTLGLIADGGDEFTPEMRRAFEELKAAAASAEHDASNGGAIPKALNPVLTPLACLLSLQCEGNPKLRERTLDEVLLDRSNTSSR